MYLNIRTAETKQELCFLLGLFFLVCLRVCVNFKFLLGNLLNVSKFFTARTPKAAGLNFVSTSIRI